MAFKFLFRKVNLLFIKGKIAYYLFLILLLTSLFQCNSGNSVDEKTVGDTPVLREDSASDGASLKGELQLAIDNQLYILYADVNEVLKRIQINAQNKAKSGLTLQYYINSTGILTMAVFKAEKDHKKFDSDNVLILEKSIVKVCAIPNDLFFGDQELSEKNYLGNDDLTPVITEIMKHPNGGVFEGYITFSPKLEKSGTNIAGSQTVTYSVGYAKTVGDIEKFDSTAAVKTIIPIGVSLNPSPPRGGY